MPKEKRLHIRLNEKQKEKLERDAEAAGEDISIYVRKKIKVQNLK